MTTFPFLHRSTRKYSSHPVKILKVKLTKILERSHKTEPLGNFLLKIVSTDSQESINHSLNFFKGSTDSNRSFYSWSSDVVGCEYLYLPTCLYILEGSVLFCDFNSLVALKIVVDFQFIHLLFSWELSNDFQVPYLSKQKPEVYCVYLYLFYFLLFLR